MWNVKKRAMPFSAFNIWFSWRSEKEPHSTAGYPLLDWWQKIQNKLVVVLKQCWWLKSFSKEGFHALILQTKWCWHPKVVFKIHLSNFAFKISLCVLGCNSYAGRDLLGFSRSGQWVHLSVMFHGITVVSPYCSIHTDLFVVVLDFEENKWALPSKYESIQYTVPSGWFTRIIYEISSYDVTILCVCVCVLSVLECVRAAWLASLSDKRSGGRPMKA